MRYLLALVFLCPIIAQAECGSVNGIEVCTEPPGCGVVNGEYKCADPVGCGMVNGVYRCYVGEDEVPVTPSGDAPQKQNAGVVAGLEWLTGFFGGAGADTWIEGAGVTVVKHAVLAYLSTKLQAMKFAWSVAKTILQDLQIFQALASAASALPEKLNSALAYFNIWAAISTVLTALMTKFVMRIVPGL